MQDKDISMRVNDFQVIFANAFIIYLRFISFFYWRILSRSISLALGSSREYYR